MNFTEKDDDGCSHVIDIWTEIISSMSATVHVEVMKKQQINCEITVGTME